MNVSDKKAQLLKAMLKKKGIASAKKNNTAEKISRINRDGANGFPLSFAQEQLWVLDQLFPHSPVYNIPVGVCLQGDLNVEALKQSLQAVVRSHETLRTYFVSKKQAPVAVINDDFELQVDFIQPDDASSKTKSHIITEIHKAVRTTFDLDKGPLIKASIWEGENNEYYLLILIHHIVCDGWSVSILLDEISEHYNAITGGVITDNTAADASRALAVNYIDFSQWQRDAQGSDVCQKRLKYWKSKLSGELPVLDLPTDFPRPPVTSFNGAIRSLKLSMQTGRELSEFCKSNNITPFMLMFSVYNLLICRYTGSDDVLVGTPINSRSQKELEGIIGYFINTVVLRTDLSASPTVAEFIVRVRNMVLEAFENQATPLGKIADELKVGRDLSKSTLFQVMFAMQNIPDNDFSLNTLTTQKLSSELLHTRTSKVDLNMVIEPAGESWDILLEYNADIFSTESIDRFLAHYTRLLSSFIESPEAKVHELTLLTEGERADFEKWNDTAVEYDTPPLLQHKFEQLAKDQPDNVAIEFEGEQLSYAELDKRASQCARYLSAQGVKPGAYVGLFIQRSVEMLVAIYGTLKAGAAYIPIDPDYPQERINYIISDANIHVVLTHEKVDSTVLNVAQIIDMNSVSDTKNSADEIKQSQSTEKDVAYVIYTSGTTGQPKGVMVSHKAIINRLEWMQQQYTLDQGDVVLQKTPYAFDVSVWELFWPLMSGATLCIAKPEGHKDPTYLKQLIKSQHVTALHFVPSMLKAFLDIETLSDCDDLKRVFCSGETLPYDTVQLFFSDSDAQLHNLYGPTEAAVDVSYWQCQANDPRKIVPIGVPVANTQFYILDKYLCRVPLGVIGELYISGVQLANGYLNKAALSDEKFPVDPFSAVKNAKMYRTGDLVRYLKNGEIEYIGRTDFQVKVRGFRIELGEIESGLSTMSEINQCLAMVQKDASDTACIVVFYIKNKTAGITVETLRDELGKTLPDYMVPQYFVEVESFALTANGKIDRKRLPLITDITHSQNEQYIAPRNETEVAIETIWSDVIGINDISVHDNFFNIGGHSLLATQVISRLKKHFEVDLPLRSLFDVGSIAALAEQIVSLQKTQQQNQQPAIEKYNGSEPVALSFSQQRLWYLDQLEPENPVYNIPVIYQLSGDLQIEYLTAALQTIYMRHEVLRTSLQLHNGVAVQIVDEASLNIEIIDMTEQDEFVINELIATESVVTFRLEKSPLVRIKLLKISAQKNILMLVVHHSLFDGWSTQVLMNELRQLYSAAVNETEMQLPELSIQYSDYAIWQRNWLQGEVLQQQLDYWTTHLQGELPVLELPTDFARPSHFNYIGQTYSAEIPASLMNALDEPARSAGVTPFMLALSVYITLLYRYTGQTDIITGTIIANRNQAQTENLLGYFANTLAIRTQFDTVPTFSELLAQVRENCLNAYTYQDLPFERLVEELNPDRELSHTPVYQTLFSYNSATGQDQPLADIELKALSIESQVARTDLSFSIEQSSGNYRIDIEYCRDLFKEQSIARFTEHYINLLQSIVKTPQLKLYELAMLTESDFSLIADSNNTAKAYPDDQCIHHIISQQVKQAPQAIAISYNGADLSYQQLEEKSDKLAEHLITLDIKADQLIALCVNRSTDMLVAMLGILKSGAAYLPLDPDYPADRIEFILEDADVSVMLTETSVLDILPQSKTKNILLDQPWDQQLPLESSAATVVDVKPQNVAYTIYTSGSTGKPKGVLVPHGTVVNFLSSMAEKPGLKSGDVLLAVTTLSFDIAVLELFLPLFTGAKIELADRDAAADGTVLLEKISRAGVNVMQATPATWRLMLASGWQPGSELKVLCGGEAMPADLAVELLSHASSVWNMYGPTETTVWSTLYQITDAEQPILIGKPIANTQIHILDKNRQLLPAGVAGEMYIAGAGVTRGYLKRPELTCERFLTLSINGAEPEIMYRTGDLVRYLADGNIEYINRLDNQVKVRGFRIELGEIENVLVDHDEVKQTVVIVREDRPGDTRLVAYYVSTDGDEISVTSLRKHLRAQLPDYMIPQHFVELEKLPVTPNGKINRQALPAPFSDGAGAEDFVEPSTENEMMIAEIWKAVLDIDKVSVNDNFFEIGGHSLLSVQVISKVKEKTGIKLELRPMIMDTLGQIAAQCPKISVESEPVSENEPVNVKNRLSLVERIKMKVKSAIFKA